MFDICGSLHRDNAGTPSDMGGAREVGASQEVQTEESSVVRTDKKLRGESGAGEKNRSIRKHSGKHVN